MSAYVCVCVCVYACIIERAMYVYVCVCVCVCVCVSVGVESRSLSLSHSLSLSLTHSLSFSRSENQQTHLSDDVLKRNVIVFQQRLERGWQHPHSHDKRATGTRSCYCCCEGAVMTAGW